MAKAAFWTETDAEARKRGEQTGLDTLVVHAVNDEASTRKKQWEICFCHKATAIQFLSICKETTSHP